MVSRRRALLNFVLRRNGYLTLYLDLGHREKYLDAVEEDDNGLYQPIVGFLSEVYLAQHRSIHEQIIGKIRAGRTDEFTEYKRLVQEFSKIQEATKGRRLIIPK